MAATTLYPDGVIGTWARLAGVEPAQLEELKKAAEVLAKYVYEAEKGKRDAQSFNHLWNELVEGVLDDYYEGESKASS